MDAEVWVFFQAKSKVSDVKRADNMAFNSETASKGGRNSRRKNPVKKALEGLINELLEDKLTAEDLWADIMAIENPAQRFDRKMALLEFKLPKPKQIDVTIDSGEGGYLINGLIPPKHVGEG